MGKVRVEAKGEVSVSLFKDVEINQAFLDGAGDLAVKIYPQTITGGSFNSVVIPTTNEENDTFILYRYEPNDKVTPVEMTITYHHQEKKKT